MRVFMRLRASLAATLHDCEILLRVLGIFPGIPVRSGREIRLTGRPARGDHPTPQNGDLGEWVQATIGNFYQNFLEGELRPTETA